MQPKQLFTAKIKPFRPLFPYLRILNTSKFARVWIQTSDLCCLKRPLYQLSYCRGGSPGLVVLGGDLCSECRGFESRHHILDGHNIFSHIFVVGIVMFV